LKSLNAIAVKLGDIATKTNQTFRIEQPNIALAVKYSEPNNLDIVAVENVNKSLGVDIFTKDRNQIVDPNVDVDPNSQIQTARKNNSRTINNIYISSKVPEIAFKNNSLVVYSYIFRDDTLFQDEQQLLSLKNGRTPRSSISSAVLDVTIGMEKIENLTTPIEFKFKKIRSNDRQHTSKEKFSNNLCTFWNPNAGEYNLCVLNIFVAK